MHSLIRTTILAALAVLLVLPFCVIAQDERKTEATEDEAEVEKERPNDKVSDDQRGVAEFVVGQLDGETQMLLNGLRYLRRPRYEEPIMEGLVYEPCPLPSLDDAVEEEMTLPVVMRLWAFLQAGWPFTPDLKREFERFLDTEFKRYNHSLAAYGAPMMVCCMAMRREEISSSEDYVERIEEKSKRLMYLGMKKRKLTDADSPAIKGMVIQPMWYGNQLWRILMARAAVELDVDYNSNVVESDMKNLSHAAQKELGWISTQGKGMTPDNDLNSNLLAMAAISQAMASDDRDIDKYCKRSFEKRLKYMHEIFSRLEGDWPEELRTGGRLCLVRTLDKTYGPEEVKPIDWRHAIRVEAVENMYASGAVHTDHTLIREMGLFGRTNRAYANAACETALACLSVCGGLYPEPDDEDSPEHPLDEYKEDDLDMLLEAFSLLHASVLPEIPPPPEDEEEAEALTLEQRVEVAIEQAKEYLLKAQNVDGSFGAAPNAVGKQHPAYTAACIHALMHAGLKPSDARIKKGVAWLRDNSRGMTAPNATTAPFNAYDAGIILMMYGRYYEEVAEEMGVFNTSNQGGAMTARRKTWLKIRPEDRQYISQLVSYLNGCHAGEKTGGWGYTPQRSKEHTRSDNSVSQFAGCGYKAASTLGAPVKMEIFEIEAKTLVEQYGFDPQGQLVKFQRYEGNNRKGEDERYVNGTYAEKTWPFSIRAGGWGYGRKRYMSGGSGIQFGGTGMAILAACRDELWAHQRLPLALHRDIDVRMFGAQLHIAEAGRWVERYPEVEPVDEDADGADKKKDPNAARRPIGMAANMYDWYAVERGCVMAGYDIIGGDIDWYRCMAGWLVDEQSPKGDWRGNLHTAWGVLILRKAAPRTVTTPPVPEPEKVEIPDSPTTPEPKPEPKPLTDREKFPVTPGPVKPEKDPDAEPEEEEEEEEDDQPSNPVTPGPGDDEEEEEEGDD